MTSANSSPPRSGRHVLFLGVLLVVITLAWSEPLWLTFGKTGRNDWGISLNLWEVRWKSLLEYGQWPAFNPWQGGGLPVNPGVGYFSVQAVTTLLCGPKAGLSLFIIAYLLIGLWGYWCLAGEISPDPLVATFLAAIGTASPGLAIHLTAGHLIFANLLVWPAILYFLLRAERDRWSGLKAGLLFALGFNEFAFYLMQYGGCIAAVLWASRFFPADCSGRRALTRFAALGAIAALPFMLPTVVGILEVAKDYTRVANTPTSQSLAQMARAYLIPTTELRDAIFIPTMKGWWGSWEFNCYLGWGVLLFFIAGCVHTQRWFHAAAALCLWLTVGNQYWWQPMYWLMETPLFASLQSFNRLRLFTHLFFVLGAAWGFALVLNAVRTRPWPRQLVIILASLAVLEVLLVSHATAQNSHVAGLTPPVANAHQGKFYQRFERLGLPAVFDGWPVDLMHYTRANIGIAYESAATDSSFRDKTRVRTVNHGDYVGEFVQNGKPVEPAYWSPNRVVFERLDANAPLTINLNRGSPWRNFHHPLFPGDRIVEFDQAFRVEPNARGEVDLDYVLPGQRAAWWWSLAMLVAGVVFCLWLRRRDVRGADRHGET